MSEYKDIFKTSGFRIEDIDTSNIQKINDWLPKNGVMDVNIAEQGLVKTLHAINFCQEVIPKIDLIISERESNVNKAWTTAALDKAKGDGVKTAKDKEWFAQADDDYIRACNELSIARAAKKWFENKADYFTNWHYALKTFLKRDYSLEMMSGSIPVTSNIERFNSPKAHGRTANPPNDFGGDFQWDDE